MNNSIEVLYALDRLAGIFSFLMGLIFLIFHKQIGEKATAFQLKFFRIKFPIKLNQIMYFVSGLVFIIFGTLAFFEKIKFRH